MTYLLLKYLHILAAVFLFGFGMGSYLYLIAATRSRVAQVIAHVARMVVFFDTWITTPAGFLQLGTGIALVALLGLSATSGWVFGSLVLFFAVGALWLPVLWLQSQMLKLARQATERGEALGPDFQQAYTRWFWMGVVGFLGMFVILLMMVTKLYPHQFIALYH